MIVDILIVYITYMEAWSTGALKRTLLEQSAFFLLKFGLASKNNINSIATRSG